MKKVVSTVILLILVLTFLACSGSEKWPAGELASRLPKPDTGKVERVDEFSGSLYIRVKGVDAVAFEKYIKQCTDAGFTIEASKESSSYEAFNEEGYSLDLSLYKSSKEMTIDLSEPIRLADLRWPAGEAGKQIPKPNSAKGKTVWEYDRKFYLYVGDTSMEQYQNYVEKCMDAGFTVDYNRWDTIFRAKNASGYKLDVEYVGFGIMSIYLDEPEENAESATPDPVAATEVPTAVVTSVPTDVPTAVPTDVPTAVPTEQPKSNTPASDLIRDDIKNAIDSYEAFVDEYCAFVETYDPTNFASMTAYLSLVQKELEMSAKFQKIKDQELTTAEILYYAEVETRCAKKMLDAAAALSKK